jgi:hypothetical protein
VIFYLSPPLFTLSPSTYQRAMSSNDKENNADMKINIDPARAKVLCENLAGIKQRVDAARKAAGAKGAKEV